VVIYKVSKSEMKKINTYTLSEVTEDDVFKFSMVLCDNEIDRDFECFSDNALITLKSKMLGKTIIHDHDCKSDNQIARIYSTKIETVPDRLTKYGEQYKRLVASAYIPKIPENEKIISEINSGIKKEGSISCSANKKTCSICKTNNREVNCEHYKNEIYDGKMCYKILDDIQDGYEWSFVAIPAQPEAMVIQSNYNKNYKGENGMEKNDVNTNAEPTIEITLEKALLDVNFSKELNKMIDDRTKKAVSEAKKSWERIKNDNLTLEEKIKNMSPEEKAQYIEKYHKDKDHEFEQKMLASERKNRFATELNAIKMPSSFVNFIKDFRNVTDEDCNDIIETLKSFEVHEVGYEEKIRVDERKKQTKQAGLEGYQIGKTKSEAEKIADKYRKGKK